jgi:hypothetical protein
MSDIAFSDYTGCILHYPDPDGARLTEMKRRVIQFHLFLEQAEGYVNALEKSTSPVKRLREVFQHRKESC